MDVIIWCYVLAVSVLPVLGNCPTLFYPINNQCVCNYSSNFIKRTIHCHQLENRVYVKEGHCVTYTGQEGHYFIGGCPFFSVNRTDRNFWKVPSDPDDLNETLCGPYNRKGLLCGKCMDGFGPPPYPLGQECVNCSKLSTGSAAVLYVLLQYVPVTLLFVGITLFRLDVTSGPLLGYMLFCQFFALVAVRKSYMVTYTMTKYKSFAAFSLIVFTLCQFWNLKFLMPVISEFCISERLKPIHFQMLDLLGSLYLFALFVITCIIMEHYPHSKIIRILWKPFDIIIRKAKVNKVGTDSVVRAFATVILLSSRTNVHVLLNVYNRSFDFLIVNGTFQHKKDYVYLNPYLTFLSHEHLVYLSLSVIPCFLLVITPSLVLCLYPTRIYRFVSRFISDRKQLGITAFAEALNHCFKDGLNGTRDYRAMAGLLIIYEILEGIVNMIIWKTLNRGFDRSLILAAQCFISSFVISFTKPCKTKIGNISLSYHLTMTGIMCVAYYLWLNDIIAETQVLLLTLIVVIPTISHLLILVWGLKTFIFSLRFAIVTILPQQ